jgi:hypothetical protein
METNETPKWKYFIPFYGIYATYKSETPGKGKWWLVSILVTLIFVSLFTDKKKERTESASSSSSSSEATASSEIATESPKKTEDLPKVGQMVKTDKFEITLTKFIQKSVVGSEYFNQKASEGATFVAVEYKYKNVSGKPISSFDLPRELKLIGPDGIKYESDTGASSNYATETKNNSKIMSDLNPGITSNNSTVFEISIDSWKQEGWSLLIDADDNVYYKLK